MSSTRFSISRPSVSGRAPSARQPVVEFGPHPLVRPVLRVVAGRALEVVAGDLGASGHMGGEAARMDAEDDAVGGRRRLGEEREPADAVVVPGDGGALRRHAAARHAARAVAARDDIAVDAPAFARVRVRVRHRGPVRIDGVQFHVAYAEADVAARARPRTSRTRSVTNSGCG